MRIIFSSFKFQSINVDLNPARNNHYRRYSFSVYTHSSVNQQQALNGIKKVLFLFFAFTHNKCAYTYPVKERESEWVVVERIKKGETIKVLITQREWKTIGMTVSKYALSSLHRMYIFAIVIHQPMPHNPQHTQHKIP